MRLGKYALHAAFAVSLFLPACSSGSDPIAINSITAAVQDLDLDPTGRTTTLTFARASGLAGASAANFVAEDGETATSVAVVGSTVTVEWDGRVTPSNRVRTSGLPNVAADYVSVTTSDASAPAFAITSGTQVAGLGGDEIVVTWSGPYVVAADALDLDNWTLRVQGLSLDLTGSTFDFDEGTQVLTITLGSQADLHASFTLAASNVRGVNDATVASTAVAGVAAGDATAPALVSVVQNLDEDEYGRVVDLTFDEAMSPLFSTSTARFSVAGPVATTSVEQPSPEVLRVTFSAPVVPGQQEVTLDQVVDAHGNAHPDGSFAVTQPAPVANAFASTPAATTVANAGGDSITVVTTQALDPVTAIDPAAWTLIVDGAPIDLADQVLDYDLIGKTLTIELDFDLSNGDAFSIAGAGVLDVDGEAFALSSGGTVAGDAAAPLVSAVVQNRNVDPTGRTLDVQFSEDVRTAGAQTLGNYSISGAQALQSATLLAGLDTVRLVFDTVVIPGDFTLAVTNVADLAGNALVAVPAATITSTDATRPNPTVVDAVAIAGAQNDVVAVLFDDDLIASEIEDPSNWTIESPVGTPVSTAGATVSYTSSSRLATLILANAENFQRGDDYQVAFTNARDLGGNVVTTTTLGGLVNAETRPPEVRTVYRESSVANELVVVFTEPCAHLDDLYDALTNPSGTRYDLRDDLGNLRGRPATAVPGEDGLLVRLSFGFSVNASDTLDVLGATDLAGNPLLPAVGVATVAEDTAQPSLRAGFSTLTAVSGENNDLIEVVFDRPMNPWGLTEPGHYEITGPAGLVDIANASFTFDGDATVTIRLRAASANDLVTGAGYTLAVNEVWSAQGTRRTSADVETPIPVLGDAVAPFVAVGAVRLDPADANSLLVTADETLSASASALAANYDLNSGTLATSASRIGARVVRVTFPVAPTAGDTLEFTVTDLAGNATGSITRVVTSADVAAPLLTAVSGTIVPGYGGDYVEIAFDEPVTNGVLALPNWTLTSNGSPVSLAGARATMLGSTSSVRIYLGAGIDLDSAGQVAVTLASAADFSGNSLAGPVGLAGAVAGDSTPPSALQSFVNWRVDPSGATIDVWFDEDVEAAVAGLAASWSASGGVTVSAAALLERDHYRLTLSAPLSSSGTVSIANLRDPARNAAGVLVFDPLE
ncbi:MAG: hypothetical protein JNK02_07275 [Planctomycetes bacterium]|nr:hypothetical protein [Planctomycetota bacterium]